MSEIKSIGIIGAGTAGYLAALCLKKQLPRLEVTILESPRIPIIGVGEATTSLLVGLLHDVLNIDMPAFHRAVQPTWKMGLRFWWGPPGAAPFDYPFGPLDLENAHYHAGDLKNISLTARLMDRGKSFLVPAPGKAHPYEPIEEAASFAYHLDNQPFVDFLRATALARGIRRLETEIAEAPCNESGQIEHLVTTDGRRLAFDLYVDCSGFRSILMGKALGSPFHSYAGSLLTDRAVVAAVPRREPAPPYTSAVTMNSGWHWNIPLRHENHVGYVYASEFCTEEEAVRELRSLYPAMSDHRLIRFRSGRRDHFWKGNVVAIGNAYGFIEPLDATGIHLTINMLQFLIAALSGPAIGPDLRHRLNFQVGQQWDYIRWLIAIQFRFNRKLDTPFWRTCNNEVDISDHAELIDVYRTHGLISRLPRPLQYLLIPPQVYRGLVGNNVIDTKLLGLGIEPKPKQQGLSGREAAAYQAKIESWKKVADQALPYQEVLERLDEDPACIDWERLRFGARERSFAERFYAPLPA